MTFRAGKSRVGPKLNPLGGDGPGGRREQDHAAGDVPETMFDRHSVDSPRVAWRSSYNSGCRGTDHRRVRNGEIRHLEKIADSIQCDVVGEIRKNRKAELEEALDTLKK